MSRTQNSKRNIAVGLVYKAICIVFPFLNRTAILWLLGEEYQGLSSLFTSILQVLGLAELGFSSAVVFSMYKPIAEHDDDTICALLNLYRRVYSVIGCVVLAAGAAVMPFLKYLIKGSYPNEINLYLLFGLYLADASVSYFTFAYKATLLNAHQRSDLTNLILSITSALRYIFQFLVLLLTRNYYLYVLVSITATVANNLIAAAVATKKYPQYTCRGTLPGQTIAALKKQISGLMIYRVSDVARNASVQIILSALFGLTTLAVYGNYYSIYTSVYGVMLVVTEALSASIGDSISVETQEKNYRDFVKFSFIFQWFSSFCTVVLACLYQPFMRLWAGEDLMLGTPEMLLFCVYFYVTNMNNIRNQYFSGNGLWWRAKASYVAETVVNVAADFVLGYFFGIAGVLIATSTTMFVFNFVSRTDLLFRHYFTEHEAAAYYRQHAVYAAATALAAAVSTALAACLPLQGLLGLAADAALCMVVPNAVLWLCYRRLPVFAESKDFIVNKVLRRGAA